jgi:shikimate kinase
MVGAGSVKNISLVGFMGTGKTSVGKILGKRLNRPVMDVDRYIEEKEKRKIAKIFRDSGEAYFRSVEKEAIREISRQQGLVITTGGGAVIDPENFQALKASGWVIGLSATPETIYQRVKDSRHRPLLGGEDKFSEIKRLLEARKPFYEKADFYFETDGQNSAQVAGLIIEKLADQL